MSKQLLALIVIVLAILGFYVFNSYIYNEKQGDPSNTTEPTDRNTDSTTTDNSNTNGSPVQVIPTSHASGILQWDNAFIYFDPTGNEEAYASQPAREADIILITDIHGDHLNEPTIKAVLGEATLVVPQAVKDILLPDLAERAQVLANGETTTILDFDITGVPMYNLPESEDSRHTKGRGNGYIIERDGYRVYIAGDTSATPEVKALTDIDTAFVPMNPPFTMTVEEAAEGVLAFKPKQVYPYHYRGQDGLSDVNKFKELVDAGNEDIEVILVNWYPEY